MIRGTVNKNHLMTNAEILKWHLQVQHYYSFHEKWLPITKNQKIKTHAIFLEHNIRRTYGILSICNGKG